MRPVLLLSALDEKTSNAVIHSWGNDVTCTESELEGARQIVPNRPLFVSALLQRRHWGWMLFAALAIIGLTVASMAASKTGRTLHSTAIKQWVSGKSDRGSEGGREFNKTLTNVDDEGKRVLTVMRMGTRTNPLQWKVIHSPVEVKIRKDVSSETTRTSDKCSIVQGQLEGDWIRLDKENGNIKIMDNERVLLTSLEDVSYQKISSGTCFDVGMFPITDPDTCNAAARALNLPSTGMREAPLAPLPEGCYLLSNQWLFLGTNSGNKGIGALTNREPICSTMEPCKIIHPNTCLIHTSYGVNASTLSNDITLPIKRQYADRHGYQLIVAQEPSFEKLAENHFGRCAGGFIRSGRDHDKQTVAKFCSVWAAFERGCEVVMWTDSDSVITLSEVAIEQWLALSPEADIYWSVSDSGAWDYCHRAEPTPAIGCGSVGAFVSCLNTGAFIMRNTPWSWTFLGRVMAQTRRTTKSSACSTAKFNPHGFDQCRLPTGHGVGDQCAVSCTTIDDSRLLGHFECFGFHLSPVFQQTLWYMGVVKYHWNTRHDAFVVNCIGEHKPNCTSFAIAHRLPPEKQGYIVKHIMKLARPKPENSIYT